MDIENNKYDKAYNFIEEKYNQLKDWEKIRKGNLFNGTLLEGKDLINVLSSFIELLPTEFNLDIWRALVDYKREQMENREFVKLGRNIENNLKKPTNAKSTWKLYKQKLINQNWSFKSIQEIEAISFDILKRLSKDTQGSPVKGLVMGNVQSGKTANMAGLMAMAADNGFNFFIILSGMIENLRKQTAKRIYNDMNPTGDMQLHWQLIEHPSIRSNKPEHNISSFDLTEESKNRYFTVALKNVSRLENLIRWLKSDPNKARQLKILVIDDEADQASINTEDIYEDENTRINELIKTLVHTKDFKAMNYIAYTATPYANILNETSKDSLYPKDFMYLLEESEDYIGPKQLFNKEEPEAIAPLPIVRAINDDDREIVKKIEKTPVFTDLPQSFKDALHWFIITVAIQRYFMYNKPVSMLIHTSFKISEHDNIALQVQKYLEHLKHKFEDMILELEILYIRETNLFNREDFLRGMEDYSTPESVPEFPAWKDILPYIERIIRLDDDEYVSPIQITGEGELKYHRGFHLIIDNSQPRSKGEMVRLVYPENEVNPSPAFIVIGGNTLSRGLTLEGLTSTYFLRNTQQADTLMQMARWFGYRKGYEILPRVWMDSLALRRFEFLNQMNEELREEIRRYSRTGQTPMDYAPKIKNSPHHQLIRITSKNKMQSARPSEFDFSGINSQITYFENNEDVLLDNLSLTKRFLNSLPFPEIKRSHMIWRNISLDTVRPFLENYHICNQVIVLREMKAMLDWLEKEEVDISSWNVVYSAVGDIEKTKGHDSNWNIHGYSPTPSKRSKIANLSSDNIANIGVLRSPTDLLIDVKEINKEQIKKVKNRDIHSVRWKYGYGSIPQLLIYRIDKGDDLDSRYHQNLVEERKPLNFKHDIIGINVMIPSEYKVSNRQIVNYWTSDIQEKIYEQSH